MALQAEAVPIGGLAVMRSRAGLWALVALLGLAIFINYIDRGNLATAAPLIKDELSLSNTQTGILLSAFYWTYAPVQLLVGWATERYRATTLLACSVALWSLATALTGLAGGFAMLLLLRLLLGFGESGAYPCICKLVAENLPPEKFGAATGVIGSGLAFGPAVGTLAGGLVMAHYGWRATFLAFGGVSILWLVPWLLLVRSMPARAPTHRASRVPGYLAILRQRAAWGAIPGHFASNYTLYFVLTWLPLYLVKDRGFSMTEMAELGAASYVVFGLSSILMGWLCDRWIAAGASINRVRKTSIVTGHVGAALCMLVSTVGGPALAVSGLLATGLFLGLINSSLFAIAQTIAGPDASGKWVALQNAIANFAGVLAPSITGLIIDRTGTFAGAFALTGIIVLLGAFGWGVVVPRVAPIDWSGEE